MQKSILITAAIFAIVLLSACILFASQSEDDLKALVDDLGNKAEKCFLAGDVNEMLQYYCDDVVSMPNFHPMVKGKDELKLTTEAIYSIGIKFESLESTTLEAKSCGEYVYEIGTFKQAIIMPGTTAPVMQTGKYVTIWRKDADGQLKIAVEIYNSNENPFANIPNQPQDSEKIR